jgi:hypothetical protein
LAKAATFVHHGSNTLLLVSPHSGSVMSYNQGAFVILWKDKSDADQVYGTFSPVAAVNDTQLTGCRGPS